MNKEELALFFWSRITELNTVMPAQVVAVNADSVDVRPTIARVFAEEIIDPPIVQQVPLIWPCGGGTNFTWPINVGDYVLLLCSQRNIERWLGGEDFKPPPDSSLLELTDAFAIAGINPEASFLPVPEKPTLNGDFLINGNVEIAGSLNVTDNTTLQSDCEVVGKTTLTDAVDCGATLDVTGITTIQAMLNALGGITTPAVTTGGLAFSGGGGFDGEIGGDIKTTGDVVAGTVSLKTHIHPTTKEGAPTGPPQ